MTPAAVVIELDGVLVDGAARRRDALAAACAGAGVRPPAAATSIDLSADFDDLVTDCLDAHPSDAPLAALDPTARALIALGAEREDQARIATGVTLIAGARDAIAALAHACRIAVVTRWRRADADRVLTLAELDGIVRFVVAADDGPGFASVRTRYARARSRLERAGTTGPIAALVAGPSGAAAAQAAGAHAVRVGGDVSMTGLTLTRLVAAIDAPASPAATPLMSLLSRP